MREDVTRGEQARAVFLSVLMVLSVVAMVPIGGTVSATEHADVEFESFEIQVDDEATELTISWRLGGVDSDDVHRVNLRFLEEDGSLVQPTHGEFDVQEDGSGDVQVSDILDVAFVYGDLSGRNFDDIEDVEVRVFDEGDDLLLEQFFEDLSGIEDIELDSLSTTEGTAESDPSSFDDQITVDDNVTVTGGPFELGRVSIGTGFSSEFDKLNVSETANESPFSTIEYDSNSGILTITPNDGSATASQFQQLFRNVTFENTRAHPDTNERKITFELTTSSEAATDALYNPDNGHYYEWVEDEGITWEQARVDAELKGGYLATIRNQQENDFIRDNLQAEGWIGASDAVNEGEWHWVTGPEGEQDSEDDLKGIHFFDQTAAHVAWTDPYPAPPEGVPGGGEPVDDEFNNWHPRHEPDNKFPFRGGQDYAYFQASGQWMDASANSPGFTPKGYIVEYNESPSTEPGDVLLASRTVAYVQMDDPPDPPEASITANETEIAQGDTVEFSASDSTGDIVAYEWDLTEDGLVEETGEVITHTFKNAGTHTVELTVTDEHGSSDTASVEIVVENTNPPVAVINATDEAERGETVQFDGTDSTDDVGIESFEWDFGDGSDNSTDVSPTHTYTELENYTVTLTVTDIAGNTNATTHEIRIVDSDRPTIIDFSLTPDGDELTVTITVDMILDEIVVDILDTDKITPSPDDSDAFITNVTTDDSDFTESETGDGNFSYTATTDEQLDPGDYTARMIHAENTTNRNTSTHDVTASIVEDIEPAFKSAEIAADNPDQLRITFDADVNATDDSGFSLDSPDDLKISSLNETASSGATLVFDLNRSVVAGETITVSYDNDTGTVVSKSDGSEAQGFENEGVDNNVGAQEPAFDSATISGEHVADNELLLEFDADVVDAGDSTNAFTLHAIDDAAERSIESVRNETEDGTLVLELDDNVVAGDGYELSYNASHADAAIESALDGSAAQSFTNQTVTNAVGEINPEFTGATVFDDGRDRLHVSFESNVTADNATGFSIDEPGDLDIVGLNESSSSGNTLVLDLNRTVTATDEITFSYDNATGTVVSDIDGSEAQGFENEGVDNQVEDPAFFAVSITDTNEPVTEGETLTVSVTVENTGDVEGTQTIRLEDFEDKQQDSVDVTLGPSATNDSITLKWETGSDDAGTDTITVASDDDSASEGVTVESAPASQIDIETQPQTTVAGSVIGGPPTANVTDEFGNPVENVDVTVSLNDTTFDGGETTISTDANGLAEFGDLVINSSGDYELTFDADGVDEDATSEPFTVTNATADSVTVVEQPEKTTAGEIIGGLPTAKVTDEFGNPVEGVDVTVTVNNTTFASGETTVSTDSDGLAEFGDLVINTIGDYELTFDAAGVDENATSESFTITNATADEVTVAVQPGETTAGDSISGPPTANVTDEFGNPVEGVDVTVTLNTSSFASGETTVSTDAEGLAEFGDLVINAVGDYELTFDAAGVDENTTSESFTITNATVNEVTVAVQPEETTAGSVIGGHPTANVTDEFGNPVEGVSVTVSVNDTTFDGGETTIETDAEGLAEFDDLVINTIGDYQLTFDAAGVDENATSESFTVTATDVDSVTVTVVAETATANGTDELQYVVTVEDSEGNPVEGVTVNATDNGMDITYTGVGDSVETDGDGNATFTVTSTTAQSVEFTFTEQDNDNSDTAIGTFEVGDADSVTVEVQPEGTTAGEAIEGPPTAKVTDEFGNPVEGVNVTVSVNDTTFASGETTIETDAEGLAEFDDLVIEKAGDYELTFEVNSVTNTTDVFTVSAFTGDSIVIDVQPGETTAGETIDGPPTVNVTDEFGNPVADVNVTVVLNTSSFDPGSTIEESTNATGIAEFDDLVINETGDYTLVFALTDDSAVNATSDAFTVSAADGDTMTVGVQPEDTMAGETISGPPTVLVTDAFGNPVEGKNVTVAVNTSDFAPGSTMEVETNESGIAAFHDLVINETGNFELDFVLVADSGVTATSDPFTVSSGAGASIEIVVQPGDTTAGEVIDGPPTANVTDAFGNAVEGVNVTVTLNTSSFTTGETTVETDADGQAEFSDLVITEVGDYELTFDAAGVDENATSEPFTVTNATADSVTVEEQPQETTAGEAVEGPPTVIVTDEFDNPVENVDVSVTLNTSSFASGETTVGTNADGIAEFTDLVITETGDYTLVFELTGDSSVNATSDVFTVSAADGDTMTVEIQPEDTMAGETISGPPMVNVTDAFGNPVTDETVTVAMNTSDFAPGSTVEVETNESGIAAFHDLVINETGDFELEFARLDDSNINVTSEPFTITTAADSMVIEVQPEDSVAGEVIGGPSSVNVTDAFGNPVVDVNVTVVLNTSSFDAGTVSVSTNAAGIAEFDDLVINETGDYELVFELVANESITATSDPFTVSAADADSMVIEVQPEDTTAGDPIEGPPTANVTDAFGNPITGVTVTVSVNGSFTTGALLNTTDDSGLARFPDLVIEDAGTYELTFDAAGVAENATSEPFVIEPTVAANLSIVDAPDSIEAGDGFELTINVTDEFGNAASGQSINDFTVTSEHDGKVYADDIVLDADGNYTVIIDPEQVTTADENHALTIDGDGVSPVTHDLTVNATDGDTIEVTPLVDVAIADGSDEVEFNATVMDAFDNPVEGANVNATVIGSGEFDEAATDANGNVTMSFTSTEAGVVTIQFTEENAGTVNATATFNAGDATAANTTASVPNGTVGTETEIEITVRDANDNPVTEAADNLSVNVSAGPNAGVSISTISDDGDGLYTTTYTPEYAGVDTLTITLDGEEIVDSPFNSTVSAGTPDAESSTMHADPTDDVIADGNATSTITITVTDASENPVDNESVFFEITDGDGGTLSSGPWTTDENGNATATLNSTVANTLTVTGYLGDSNEGAVIGNVSVEFRAGAIDTTTSSVVADPTEGLIADGEDSSTVTVTVLDAQENPITDLEEGNFSIELSEEAENTSIDLDASDEGNYTFDVTSTTAGTVTVNVSVDTVDLESVEIEFVAGSVNDSTSSVVADPTEGVTADGEDNSTVTVTVLDAKENPITDLEEGDFSIELTEGAENTSIEMGASDEGNYTFDVTSTTAGTVTVNVSVDEVDLDPATIEFVSGSVNASSSTVVAKPTDGIVADDVDKSTITITVLDAEENPITGLTDDVFNVTSDGENVSIETVSEVGDGVYTTNVTSAIAESVNVTVTVDEITLDDKPTVTFVVDDISADHSSVTADPESGVLADGEDSSTITVTVQDAHDNPITNLDAGNFTIELPEGASNTTIGTIAAAEGNYTFDVTSTTAGTLSVNVTVDGIGLEPVEVEFIAGSVNASTSSVVADPTEGITADGEDNSTVTVTVLDSQENPVTDLEEGDFTIELTEGAENTSIDLDAADEGNYTFDVTSTAAGTISVNVTVDEVDLDPATIEFVSGSVNASSSTVVADPTDGIVADGVDNSTITVTVLDAQENPISDLEDGNFSFVELPENASVAEFTDDGDGAYTWSLTHTDAENVTVTVEVDGVELTDKPVVEFVPGGVDSTTSSVVADPTDGIVADGIDNSTITITVLDAQENPITGLSEGVFNVTSDGEDTLVETISEVGDGVYTTNLTSSVAESINVTVTVDEITLDEQPTVTFVADDISVDNSNVAADPKTGVLADGEDNSTVTVTVLDSQENPIIDLEEGNFTIELPEGAENTSIDTAASDEGNYTFDVTSTVAGTISVNVTVDEVDLGSVSIEFVAGSVNASSSSVVAEPSDGIVADGVDNSTITITVLDAEENPITGLSDDVFNVTSDGENASIETVSEVGDGVYTTNLTSTVAENVTVTVEVSNVTLVDDLSIEFVSGGVSATESTVSADPTEGIVADGEDNSTVTVTVLDSQENPVTDLEEGNFTIELTEGAENKSLGTAASDEGNYTFDVTSTEAGTIIVNVTVDKVDLGSVSIEFVSGSVNESTSTVVADPTDGIVADGVDNSTITITVLDAEENPITGLTEDVFNVTSDGENASIEIVSEIGDGVYTTNVTSSVAEIVTVTVEVSNVTLVDDLTLEFVSGGVSATESTVSADPTTGVIADGVDNSTVTVTVLDAEENPITDLEAGNFSIELTEGAENTSIKFDEKSDGNYTFDVTSTVAGTISVNVTVDDIDLDPAMIEFVAGSVNASSSAVVADPTDGIVADGVDNSTITITVLDAEENPITGLTDDVFNVTSDGEDTSVETVSEVGDGVYTTNLTSAIAESVNVTVTVDEITLDDKPTVTFVADGISADNSSVTADPETGVLADGEDNSTITVTVQDSHDNPITDLEEGNFTIDLPAEASNTTIDTADATKGNYTFAVNSTTAGTVSVNVTVDGIPLEPVEVEFISGSVNASTSSVVADPTAGLIADGEDSSTVTVTVLDAEENPITDLDGDDFAITLPDGAENTSIDTTASDGGNYSFDVKSTVAGPISVNVSVDDVDLKPVSIEFVTGTVNDSTSSVVAAPTEGVTADGEDSSTVTVTVLDAKKNPITDLDEGNFTIELTEGAENKSIKFDEKSDGNYTFDVTSTVAGTISVNVTVDEVDLGSVSIEFSAGSVSKGTSSVVADPTEGIVADGNDNSTVTVTVLDSQENPVTDLEEGNFTIELTESAENTSIVTGASDEGNYTFDVTSTVAGMVTVNVSVDTVDLESVEIEFVTGTVNDSTSSVVADPTEGIVADGEDNSTITVTVLDAEENPITDLDEGNFTIELTEGAENTSVDTSEAADGNYSFDVTSTVAGTISVNVTVDNIDLDPATIGFVAGSVNASSSSVVAEPTDGIVADGVDNSTITITVLDAEENPITGLSDDVFNVTSDGEDTSVETVSEVGDGVYTTNVTSTVAKSVNVTVTVDEITLDDQPTVTFVADDISVDKSSVTVNPETGVIADGVDNSTTTVTVQDAHNNPITDLDAGNFTIDLPENAANTSIDTSAAADGNYTFKVTSTTAGTVSVNVTVDGTTLDSISIGFVAGAVDKSTSSVVANPTQGVTADGEDTSTVTITVLDAEKNEITDLDASNFSIALPDGAEHTSIDTTASNEGNYTFDVSSTDARTVTVNVTVDDVDLDPVSIEFVSGSVNESTSSVVAEPTDGIVADGEDTSTVTITVRDGEGNPIAGLSSGDFSINANGAENTSITAGTGHGNYTFELTHTRATSVTVTVSVDEIELDDQPTVTFVPGSVDSSESTVVADPTEGVIADGDDTSTVTITVLDGEGNALTDLNAGNFSLDVDGADNTTISTAGTGNYTFELTHTVAESVTVTVTVDEIVLDDQPTVTFIAGPVDVSESKVSAVPTEGVTADGEDNSTVTVTVLDAQENPVTALDEDNFSIALSDGANHSLIETGASAEGNYTFEVTSTEAGTATVNVTVDEVDLESVKIEFVAGSVSTSTSSVVAEPTEGIVADGEDNSTVTVTVLDAQENPISGLDDGNFSIEVPEDVETSSINVDGHGDGNYTFDVTSTVAETISVNVTVDTVELESVEIEFVADSVDSSASSVIAEPADGIVADGVDNSTITVTVLDAQENPITHLEDGNFSFVDLPENASVSSITDDGDGAYTWTLTHTDAENVTVTVEVDDITLADEPVVEFVPGSVTTATSSVIADPTDGIVADGIDKSTITITVLDAQENPITGLDDAFNITSDGEDTSIEAVSEVGDGVYTTNVTSTVAETVTVTVEVDDVTLVDDLTITFVPGGVSATESSVTADPETGIIADGEDAATVTVTVHDAQENPITDLTADEFAIELPADAANTTVDTTTATQGNYTFEVASTTAGSVSVNVTVGGVQLDSISTEFVSGAVNASTSSVVADPTEGVIADGEDNSTITITILDTDKNPISDLEDGNFSFVDLPENASVAEFTDKGDGNYTWSLTHTDAKNVSVIVKVDSVEVIDRPTVAFVAGGVDTATSTVVADPTDGIVADDVDNSTVTVTVLDANENPIADLTPGDFEIDAGDATNTSVSNLGDGMYEFELVHTTAETVTLNVTVAEVELVGPEIEFVAGAVDAETSAVTAGPTTVVANGTDVSTITVEVLDEHKNPITDLSSEDFEIDAGDATNTSVTHVGGSTYEFELTHTTAETVTVLVSADGVDLDDRPEITFVAGAVDSGTSTMTAEPSTVVANGTDVTTITLDIRDNSHNPIENLEPGDFAIDAGDATNTSVAHVGGGTYEFELRHTDAEIITVNVTVTEIELDDRPEIEFVAGGVDSSGSSVTAGPTTVVANGTDTSTITVEVLDENENPITDLSSEDIEIDAENATNTSVSNLGNGMYEFELRHTNAENVTVIVTADGVGLDDQPKIKFVAGAVDADTSAVTAEPTTVVANSTDVSTITVEVLDAHENPVTDLDEGNFSVDLGAENATNADFTNVGDGTYTWALTHTDAVTVTVTVDVDGTTIPDAPTITFVAGAIDPTTSNVTPSPDSGILADGIEHSTITVTVLDAHGNVITGLDPNAFEIDAGVAANSTVTEVGNGSYAFELTSTEPEAVTVAISVGGHLLDAQPSVVFDPVPTPPHFTVEVVGTNAPVIEGETIEVAVNVTNLGDEAGTQTLTLTDADNTVRDTVTVDLAGGKHNDSITLEWATVIGDGGTGVLTVASANETTSTEPVTVVPAVPNFEVSITAHPQDVTAGETVDVTADVTNVGTTSGTQTITLQTAAGEVLDSQSVQLDVGESAAVTLAWETTATDDGTYELTVASNDSSVEVASFDVEEPFGVEQIEVSLGATEIPEGLTTTVLVEAVYNDGTIEDVTDSASIEIQSHDIVSVENGVVTALSVGDATVVATHDGVSNSASLTVTPAVVVDSGVSVTVADTPIAPGQETAVNVEATLSNGTVASVTDAAVLTVLDQSVATVSDGTLSGVAPGMTTIEAAFGGISGQTTVEVAEDESALELTIENDRPLVGSTTQASLLETAANGSTTDVTADATWTVANDSVASVDADGVLTAIEPGTTTIEAVYGDEIRTLELTVVDDTEEAAIDIEPRSLNFGDVAIGKTATTNLTITNRVTSTEALTVETTTIVGQDPDDFEVLGGGAPFTLEPGEERTIEIGFTPVEEGIKNAQLRILSDAGNEPQIDVWLANTGAFIVVQEVAADDPDSRDSGVNVEASNLEPGSRLSINVSQPGTRAAPASFDQLSMLVDAENFQMDIVHSEEPLTGGTSFALPGLDVVQYVTILHGEEIADPNIIFDETEIEFRIDRSAVPTDDPADIALYRHNGDEWVDMNATLIGESNDSFRFVAETPGFSEFAITAVPADGTGLDCSFLGHNFGVFIVCWYWWPVVVLALGGVLAYTVIGRYRFDEADDE